MLYVYDQRLYPSSSLTVPRVRLSIVTADRQLEQSASARHLHKKVKFSHTRYRALGPELIPCT